MGAYFVTATGTDIGKTFVTAGLVQHLRKIGQAVTALKPVMSGFDPARMARSDAGVLLEALGEPATSDAVARISPWRFAAPLSPDMAARREGRSIDFDALLGWCRARIGESGTVFIEGVGGAMVPLDDRHAVLDWMVELQLPVILIAGSYLGTISHTLTAVRVCRQAGLVIAVVVINESEVSTVPLDETVATVGRFLDDLPIAIVRRIGAGASSDDFARIFQFLE